MNVVVMKVNTRLTNFGLAYIIAVVYLNGCLPFIALDDIFCCCG
jgi:hypothetical protein